MSKKSILNKESLTFLEKYLNNAAPTGYEWESQKIWMNRSEERFSRNAETVQ